MGHRDSPAQLGRHREVSGAGGGVALAAAQNRTTPGPIAPVKSSGPIVSSVKSPGAIVSPVKSPGAWLLLLLVRFYMILLSPFFGGTCKFHPSCSNYAYEAIALHGARRGLVLALKRLLRCRPFTKGGFDPVPEVVSILPEGAGSPIQMSTGGSPSEACISARTLLPHRKSEPAQ